MHFNTNQITTITCANVFQSEYLSNRQQYYLRCLTLCGSFTETLRTVLFIFHFVFLNSQLNRRRLFMILRDPLSSQQHPDSFKMFSKKISTYRLHPIQFNREKIRAMVIYKNVDRFYHKLLCSNLDVVHFCLNDSIRSQQQFWNIKCSARKSCGMEHNCTPVIGNGVLFRTNFYSFYVDCKKVEVE